MIYHRLTGAIHFAPLAASLNARRTMLSAPITMFNHNTASSFQP